MTNGEKLRKADDEELAASIICPYEVEFGSCINTGYTCMHCTLEWLRKEADDEGA